MAAALLSKAYEQSPSPFMIPAAPINGGSMKTSNVCARGRSPGSQSRLKHQQENPSQEHSQHHCKQHGVWPELAKEVRQPIQLDQFLQGSTLDVGADTSKKQPIGEIGHVDLDDCRTPSPVPVCQRPAFSFGAFAKRLQQSDANAPSPNAQLSIDKQEVRLPIRLAGCLSGASSDGDGEGAKGRQMEDLEKIDLDHVRTPSPPPLPRPKFSFKAMANRLGKGDGKGGTKLNASSQPPDKQDPGRPIKLAQCLFGTSEDLFERRKFGDLQLSLHLDLPCGKKSEGKKSKGTDGTTTCPEAEQLIVRNTFLDVGSEDKVRADMSRSCPALIMQKQWHTKFPAMEEAHFKGECSPCAYFLGKADGCREGMHCKFCHLCPPGAIKQRKKEKLKAVKNKDNRSILLGRLQNSKK